jgi:glycosidase
MSWSAEPRAAGFSAAAPFRPVSPNAASHNVAVESAQRDSLLAWYRTLIGLRNRLPALARGSYAGARVDGAVWSYRRVLGGQTVLVAINYGSAAATVGLEGLPARARFRAALPREPKSLRVDASGGLQLVLPAQSVAVYVDGAAR